MNLRFEAPSKNIANSSVPNDGKRFELLHSMKA